MRVGILGPLQIEVDGRALPAGGSRQRAVLAYLALHANQVVPTERLLVDLWGEDVPASAANALQAAVSRLRKVVPSGRLVTQNPGYVLRLQADELDVSDFTRRAGHGRRSLAEGRPDEAVRTLRSALALWRGPALADFRYEPFAQADIARLEEEELTCREDRIDAELASGTGADAVAELRSLVTAHPVRERLRGQLMRALYRTGRQTEALEVFRELRDVLQQELGIDPSPELTQLETAILRQDPALLIERRPGRGTLPGPFTTGGRRPGQHLAPGPGQFPGQLPPLPPAAPLLPVPTPPAAPPPRLRRDPAGTPLGRRLITVLTVELRATTGDGDPVDPETLHHLHARAETLLDPVLTACGGRLAPGAGSRIGGVFGVDVVHEDDAARATRAAIEARTALADEARSLEADLGLQLTYRFSLASGEAVVVGGSLPGFVGGVSATASRLVETAEPGQILVSAQTHALAAAAVDVELLPSGQLALIAARRGARALPVRLGGPLIGRDAELATLLAAADDAAARRRPSLVTVLGDAGLGKTRLVMELAERLGGKALILTGRCLPYGDGITFWPLRELLGQVPGELDDVLAGEPDATEISAQLGRAFGHGAGSGSDATEIFWATRRLLEVLATRTPVVVVLEDLHWAEPTFLDLVEAVARQASGVPLTLVCLARPDLVEQRPGWTETLGGARVELGPLDDDAASRLLTVLSGAPGSGGPPGVTPGEVAGILEAAGGNPLYLEQLALASGDGELVTGRVPATLQALLAARLHRLGPGERLVLACASVVGRDFSRASVAELLPEAAARARLDAHLRTLVTRGLLQPGPPGRDGDEFSFRHALIQQAAYRAVPKGERADLHLALADWLESRPLGAGSGSGGPGTSAGSATGSSTAVTTGIQRTELLGYHLEQAARFRREVQPFDPGVRSMVERATGHLRTAGATAHELGDAAAAVRLFERADALLGPADPVRADVLTSLGAALFGAGRLEDAGRVLDDAVRLAAANGAERTLAHARVEVLLLGLQVDPVAAQERAARELPELRGSFERLADQLGACRTWMLEAAVHWNNARSADAERAWESAAHHARLASDRRHLVDCLCWLASAALWGPTPSDIGIMRCEAYLAEMEGVPTGRAEVYLHVAGLHAMRGEGERADELLARGIAILEEVGATSPTAVTEPAAFVAMLSDHPERAEELLHREYTSLRRMGEKAHLATVAALLAQTLVAQGPERHSEAEAFLAESFEAGGAADPTTRLLCDGARALVLSARGEHQRAVALARSAVSAAGGTDLSSQHADALVDLARVLEAAGRPEEAFSALSEATELYREKGHLRGEARCDRLLVRLAHR